MARANADAVGARSKAAFLIVAFRDSEAPRKTRTPLAREIDVLL